MWKKILISIGLMIILIAGIEIFNISKKNKPEEEKNIVQNETEISTSRYVKDDCINEWKDYSETVQNDIRETSENLNDENKHYILREKDGFINIYYINENGDEILYRVTDISIEYLGDDDIKKLDNGIEVVGIQKVNELLEDYEWCDANKTSIGLRPNLQNNMENFWKVLVKK